MFPVKIVESSRHAAEPLSRINQHRLRRLELFAGLKLPLEILRVNPHNHSNLVELVVLYGNLKITGVHKMHGVNLALLLAGSLCNQSRKRMVLMAGLSP